MGDVRRSGLLFRSGNYEDKSYSMTPDELRAAVAAFRPVPVDLEHTPTVLSNKLGRVESVELSADGNSLLGTVALPEWLDGLIEDGQRKVSCTWDRATKTLSGLALVLNPRIDEAAIFASFSAAQAGTAGTVTTPPADFAAARHDTQEGQGALQVAHDLAAQHGAVCDKANARAAGPYGMFAAAHEVKALQLIHDHAVKHGAQCSPLPMQAAMGAAEEEPMHDERKFMDHLKAFFLGEDKQPPATVAEVVAVRPVTPAPKVEDSAAFQAAQAEIAQLRTEKLAREAASFADGLVRESKLLPAQRDALVAAYLQSAKADAATFAAGDRTPTLDTLKALYTAAPAHSFTQELTDSDGAVVFANREKTPGGADEGAPMTPARRRELLSLIPEGRAILDTRDKAAR